LIEFQQSIILFIWLKKVVFIFLVPKSQILSAKVGFLLFSYIVVRLKSFNFL